MSAQIKISKVGVPSEKDTAIPRSAVTSADPAGPANPKLDVTGSSAMSSNNMPAGRKP